ncbi:MFS transporter [Prauserella flavalba]|uniref:Major facilitator superfamily (MFS) profile domain-containing protein n=1 Tax=Prauserella flavalba TaxID=1477506 RepID=A0A318LV58_9PSEU|nr:MFS transporter [Prauserella flavalba]PXY38397.1 hypothetical protein BA062_01165 [Prauserella flavalba]
MTTTAVSPGTGRRVMLTAAAVCSGVTVANIYLAQPVLGLIAEGLGTSRAAAGWVATAALLGYALGVLFVVPLGDNSNRRRLVATLSVLTSALLVGAALAPSVPVLAWFAALAAVTTVVPQVIVPLVVQRAEPSRRAVSMGWVQAGLIAGMMLSRVLGGQLGALWGWRAVYLVAAGLTLVTGLLTARVLPREGERAPARYRDLLRSLPGYVRGEPALRGACLRQAGMFAAFNVVWSTVVLALTAPPHGLGVGTAGLVGLLGLGSAAATPLGGRFVDRRGPLLVSAVGFGIFVVGTGLLLLGGSVLPALLAGMVVMPVGLQLGLVSNQAAALAVDPAAGGRLNTVFMLAAFLGGSAGSAVGAAAYGAAGWTAACLTAFGLLGVGALGYLSPGSRRPA